MVYSAASLADLSTTDRESDADLVEQVLAGVAVALFRDGCRRFVIAGGESSGRVMAALGVTSLRIGPAIAPGVAWSEAATADGARLAVALKSGNFGEVGLFVDAWDELEPAA